MNRTIKGQRRSNFHYDNHEQSKMHPQTFMEAYDFARRSKTLKGLTLHKSIGKTHQNQPQLLKIKPCQKYAEL